MQRCWETEGSGTFLAVLREEMDLGNWNGVRIGETG